MDLYYDAVGVILMPGSGGGWFVSAQRILDWNPTLLARYADAILRTAEMQAMDYNAFQVLAGARAVFDAEGVTLLGGHTGAGEDLAVGFTLWGEAANGFLLPVADLEVGQVLILTKALGTGVLFHADMRGQARGEWVAAAYASMQQTCSSPRSTLSRTQFTRWKSSFSQYRPEAVGNVTRGRPL